MNRQIVKRSVKTAFSLMPLHFTLNLFVCVLVAALPLFGMEMNRRVYSYVGNYENGGGKLGMLLFPLAMYALYLLIMKAYTIYYVRVYVQFGAILKFEKKIKMILHKKCGEISMNSYENPIFYNGQWEAKVASTNIYRLTECVTSLFSIALGILLLSGYAASINPAFFVFVVLDAIPAFTEQYLEGILRSRRQSMLASAAKEERARYDTIVGLPYAKERIVYHSYDMLKEKWSEAKDQYLDTEYALGIHVLKIRAVLTILRFAATGGIYILASFYYLDGAIDYAGFVTAISVSFYLQAQYGDLFETAGYYSRFSNMVKPFFRFMDSESAIRIRDLRKNSDALILKNVSFAYPTSTGDVLKNINMSIRKGEKIAVVGVNGAGKSTLAKILSGELSPTEGSIEGGVGEICMMLQDYGCYGLTKEENIAISERTPQDQKKIKKLSGKLGIENLPSGKILGREFGDTDLSGGQWQRIAMSRLYYHGGEMILLDEPTSAIDPLYEKKLNEFIMGDDEKSESTENTGNLDNQENPEDTTLVVISHRLSIAKLVDRIYVMDDGQIKEEGTHRELIEREDSLYKKLWDAQVSWY